MFYLRVDGVPLRSSVMFGYASANAYEGTLQGVTPGVVAAGTHTVDVGAECTTRTNYTGPNTYAVESTPPVLVVR